MSPETVRKCFHKTRLYPEEIVEDDDPFEGEDEIDQLQELINKISSCDAGTYISAEEQIETCFGNIDSSDPNWRNTTRDQLLGCEEDEVDDEVMIVSAERRLPIFNERSLEVEDEYDVELKQPAIKSVSEAANMAEQLRDFAQFNGH